MAAYLLRRIAGALLLVFLLVTVVFVLMHAVPGEPTALLKNQNPEQRERLIQLWGLDRPLYEQYGRWLRSALLRLDWGTSFTFHRPVLRVLADAFPATLALSTAAILIHLALALGGALWSVRRAGQGADRLVQASALVLNSLPVFWLGLVAILTFSGWLPWLPAGHMRSPDAASVRGWPAVADFLRHLVLPATVLGLSGFGGTVRLLRASLLEALSQDYIRTARAKGASEARVLLVHALRNSLTPLVQVLGYTLPGLLNGSLLIETLFSWPGVGQALFIGIQSFDYPLVLGGTVLSGVLVVAGTLGADLAQLALNPRLRPALA
ncbi:MAG TPA: ABC transporter permease [Thermoanaerobaculia bacterium]|nr:ABC transporter permease [Thermoanaerobaculia bacterium]